MISLPRRIPGYKDEDIRLLSSHNTKMGFSALWKPQAIQCSPGPIYFKTPRKCGIFEGKCEVIPRKVNYLINEASSVGKGANSMISYVHHFFANHGLGETRTHLHVDNCSGKNNFFLWNFPW